ncbi:MAG: Gfo/Idh/MocA family protein [Planctomycetota bacterium]|jgi:predicted dehydrogenase
MAAHKVAVVGCGGRSRQHIQAYDHLDGAEVVACCAPSPTRREPLAEEFGLAAYADARAMIEAEAPDMVHLVTWPDTRVELMTLVSDLNVPLCTVEKPIATGVSDWRALGELARRTQTRFAVCHQFRWQPHLVKCRDALESGKLGEVKFLEFSAGMNIAGQGTHILNYGMSLNRDARVARVVGAAGGDSEMDGSHPAPDATFGYLTFENGVRALYVTGPTAPRCGQPDTAWQHVRVAAFADHGRVCWEEFGKWEIVCPDGVECGDFGGMDEWARNNLLAQAAFHRAMFDWLADDDKIPGTNLEQSLHEWKVVLALYASVLEGGLIDIAEFDPPADLVEQLRGGLKTNGRQPT